MLHTSSWFDRPSDLDFTPDLLGFWWSDDLPERVFLGDGMKIYDQHEFKYSANACGSYGSGHCSNAMNKEEESFVRIFPFDHRELFVNHFKGYYLEQYGIDPIRDGSYLSDQVRFLRKHNYITWWYICHTADEMRRALSDGRTIVTGSKRINRSTTRKAPYTAEISSGSAHIFWIVGYDDNEWWFICVNSAGGDKYDEWYFYLYYEDVPTLYTRYALMDKADKNSLNQLKIKLALGKSLVAEEKKWNPISPENYGQYRRYIDYWRNNRKR